MINLLEEDNMKVFLIGTQLRPTSMHFFCIFNFIFFTQNSISFNQMKQKLKLTSICRTAFVVEQKYSSSSNHLLRDKFEIFPSAKFVVFDHFNHLLKYESLKYVHRANLPPHRPPSPICQFEKCQNVMSESSNLFKPGNFVLF